MVRMESLWKTSRSSKPGLRRGEALKAADSYDLSPDTGHFLVGGDVDDFELLGVKPRIGAEGEFAEITLLQLDKQLLVLRAEAFEHRRVYHDAELEVRLVALAS